MARRRGNTMSSRMADSAKQTGGRLLADWAALTWRADSTKLGPVNLSVINWVLFAICLVGLWFLPGMRKIFLIALAVGFIFTLGRSAAIMPKRRKALQAIYDQNQRTAGLPRGSARNPADPKDRIQVRRWGKNAAPQEVVLTIGDCPAAISVYSHHLVERSLEASMGPLGEGQQWIFEWPDRTRVHVYPDSAESPAALRQAYNTKVRTSTKNLLGIRERDAADYHFECSEWSSEETKRGTMLEIPGRITIDYGEFDDTNPTNREKVERTLDKQLKSPGEWIFNWDDGVLELNQVDRSSTEAKQKRTLRKISDDVIGLTRSNGRNGDTPQVTVNKWMAEKHLVKLLGREDVPSNYPQHITINFGTRDLADRKKRSFFENGFDTAMGATYPQVTWLYNWEMENGSTVLYTTCVATSSKRALRKNTEARFRNVVESKFGSSRNFVDCDMLEWQDEPGPSGEQLPQTARVRFGEYDVTKRDTQEAFEQHWDSLTDACDWNYKWSPAEGVVTMDAVPPLPKSALFPQVGTDEFTWICDQARNGKIIFGPQKGGGWLTLDLNDVPHALVGGATGSGKAADVATPIRTTEGWSTLGDLNVGDTIFDENGQPTAVTGVYDQPLSDTCFEVVFSDGSTIVCDDQHLWWTEDRSARVSRFRHDKFKDSRLRQSWLTDDQIAAAQALAASASPQDTVSIPEATQALGLTETTNGPLRRLAGSLGPAEEVRAQQQEFHYRGQIVHQKQRVRVFDGPQLAEAMMGRVRHPRRNSSIGEHADGIMAVLAEAKRTGDDVCASDFTEKLGVDRETALNWLTPFKSQVPNSLQQRTVQLTVPEKTVRRAVSPVVLYPKQALFEAVAEHGAKPMWDQQALRPMGQVRTLNAIRHSLTTDSGHVNHSVPMAKPLEFAETQLPIAPYTLGAWLGDGSSWRGQITSIDPEVVDFIRDDGFVVTGQMPEDGAGLFTVNGLQQLLRKSGLLKTELGAVRKRIPREYFNASIAQRQALLAGLLDTDGTVAPHGEAQFSNTNKQLADDVLELALGLGFRATMRTKAAHLNGTQHGICYTVSFTSPHAPFRLPRKAHALEARYTASNESRTNSRFIVEVRKVQPRPMRCISVDSPTRQFLIGEQLIPTHNSVTLTVLLFLAMYNPDMFELYVCDPKRTDFTWTPEFPNVTKFAAVDEDIVATVAAAKQEMDRRRTLLSRVGVRNLRELRAKFKANPELEREHGPAPRRLILFFDELAAFLGKSANKDIEELKDEARFDLEKIGQLGRAMEVNIISAAQKPDGKIISTQLRDQLGFRLCVGPVNQYTSEQILNSNHGTRFPAQGTPKGRSWAGDSKNGYRMAQSFFIPDETGPLPWDPTAHVIGSKDMIRQHLEDLGYARTQITNRDGGTEPRWVPVESEEMNDSFDDNTPAPEQSDPIEDQGEDAQPDDETTSAPVVEEESAPAEPALPTMDEPEEEPEEQSPVAEESSPVDAAMNAATTPKQSPTRRSTQRKVTAFMDDDDSAQPF